MSERIHKATLSQSQGREGWSVIFRHPVLLDRATGKPGRRVRRGLGTKEKKAAERLVAQLNKLLTDRLFWEASSRPRALARFHPLVVDIFYHDMVPETIDASGIRELAIALPRSTDSDYRQILLLGTTGGGKTTLVRQLIGTDPAGERFPSTSTARTSIADMEIVFSSGPFRAAVTFLPRDEVRDYLEESMSAAALAAYQGDPDIEVLRRLLNHVSQRFRLSYLLGTGDTDVLDDEEMSDGSAHEPSDFDLTGTRALLRSSVERLRAIAAEHIPLLQEELERSESDDIVREELFEDSLDNLLRGDERFQALADEFMDEIDRRFDLLSSGNMEKTKQGWPRAWSYESEDRQTFLKTISRLTSNYAPHFGTLLTPLVNAIRIAGPFSPSWSDNQPKLVLFDGEGLGHTPDAQASLPTAITRRLEHVDAVLLVDNATQPMQAATIAAMRNLASGGHTGKLIVCFTHFESVVGDNIPTFKMREQHVLASAENALTSIGEQLGSLAERALRQRLQSACYFFGNLHQPLTGNTKIEKRTIEQLQKLLGAIDGIAKPEPVPSRPVYDRTNLVLAVKQAAEDFHATWNARLGLQVKPGFLKAHWLRIKALARRMGEGWSDEYLDLKPIADMHKELQESIYRFIQNPVVWTGPVPSDDEKQVLFEALAMIISLRLLVVVAELMRDESIPDWLRAFHVSGKGATYTRARLISRDIYEKVAPLLDRTPDRNKFMSDVIGVVRDAAETYHIVLQ